jgi:hypothetical protein
MSVCTALFLNLYLRGPEDDLKRVETCSPKYMSVCTALFLDLYLRGSEDDLKRVETCSPKYMSVCTINKMLYLIRF